MAPDLGHSLMQGLSATLLLPQNMDQGGCEGEAARQQQHAQQQGPDQNQQQAADVAKQRHLPPCATDVVMTACVHSAVRATAGGAVCVGVEGRDELEGVGTVLQAVAASCRCVCVCCVLTCALSLSGT